MWCNATVVPKTVSTRNARLEPRFLPTPPPLDVSSKNEQINIKSGRGGNCSGRKYLFYYKYNMFYKLICRKYHIKLTGPQITVRISFFQIPGNHNWRTQPIQLVPMTTTAKIASFALEKRLRDRSPLVQDLAPQRKIFVSILMFLC